jgi:hypothetical protein
LQVERLESRQLLSTLPEAHPMFVTGPLVQYTTPPAGAYMPAQVQQAYQFNKVSFNGVAGTGTGETIAIVDAYDDPNIQSDLNTFDTQFGLPATTITKVNETGGTTLPSADSTGGWELEESLDVEWAHAMAPGAKILLVEASSSNDSDLLSGVSYAAAHANVVSMSWGGGEFSGESSYDSYFSHAGVAFVASSGDSGAPISWPAASPNVLAVGGTALTLGSGGTYSSETGWSGSGGGPSAYVTQPSYQSGVVTSTTMRANPDVAYDAAPSTGYAVYDSYQYSGTSYGWMTIGGTSAGAPQWAAILAIADQGRAAYGQPAVDSSSAQEVMTTLYKNPGDFHDVTSGTSTGSPNYTAATGYDYVTGLGSPMVNLIIGSLDGTGSTSTPDTLVVSAPTSTTAGNSFTFIVTADKSGGTVDTGYTGTVHFTSTDGQVVLPVNYTFTAADNGTHTFTLTLKTAGTQKVTATDTATSATTGISAGIAVSPAAASQFVLSGLSSSATVGASQTFTVTAKDAYGNVATDYTGTVTLTCSDTAATFSSASYTFTTSDKGVHSFSVAFKTAGSQSVTVKDTSNSTLTAAQSGINVSPATPLNLTAMVVSSSQINLSWSAAAGATGYQLQRSLSSSAGWSTIATLSGGTTSYQNTGLSAGTTYYFRIIATGGNLSSAASNVASATTTGTGTTTTDTLWSNSYTPSENEYSSGSYELGLQFSSSVAGVVTGVRFYKESWMGGYTHVGHLWSPTGALLASAAFTNETSSGWQQVNFSNSVAIQPNTLYIVSFSTGGGYFGISSNYFSSSGVSNGPLSAPSDATYGNGVYNRAGSFPDYDGGGMNFWADVAFSPSSSTAVKTATATAAPTTPTTLGSASTAGRSGYYVAPATTATPSGPSSFGGGSRGTTGAAWQQVTSGVTSVTYRGTVPQARGLIQWAPKGNSSLDSIG